MLEIVSDRHAMTITVGEVVFDTPRLWRIAERDCSIRREIIGEAPWDNGPKAAYKYYAAKLGTKFNRRFQAANYWLWLGWRYEQRTANLFRHEGKNWWQYDDGIVKQAHHAYPYVNEAERDNLLNLVPIIVAFGASPQDIKRTIGQGAWRRVANNSVTRNMRLLHAVNRAVRCNVPMAEALVRLLDFPSGVMRATVSADIDEVIAARLAPRKTPRAFEQTKHLVYDTRMMMGDDFNPTWGLARIRAEHERSRRRVNQRHYSNKVFTTAWEYEADGFKASLLTSQLDIATEGDTQHHCVASYAKLASRGEYAVFRIDGKERATLGVRDGRLDQIYAACNGPVSDDCKAFAFLVAGEHARVARRAA